MITKTNVTNMFILCAEVDVLAQLAQALLRAGELNAKQYAKLLTLDVTKQRISIGTRYSNSKQFSADFSAGTLYMQLNDGKQAADADAADAADADAGFAYEREFEQAQQRTRASNVKSAKQWLRELLGAHGASYTLKQLCALSGKSEVNIRTMLSDLRSAKYCGSAGVFNTKSTRVNGDWYYSKA